MVALLFMDLIDDPKDIPRFTRMCEYYQNYIYTICYSRLHHVHLAEDCTWITFEQAAKQFDKFDEDILSPRVKNLLCTIAIAKCNREWTKEAKYRQLKESLWVSHQREDHETTSFENEVWEQFQVEEIQNAILELPEWYMVPVFLAKVHGYKIKEIAEICDITPETARKRISLGMKKVKERLEQKGVISDERCFCSSM